jgi:predicted nucleic acid-binding protein
MLKVVSNSSPLIHLAKLDLLHLLHNQFNEILIPRAVWAEAVEEAGNEPDAKAISKASWIKVREVSASALLTTLLAFLDKGESEAIALAIEIGADLILLDDSDARQAADFHGLKKIGLLGVLIKAKRQGNIPSLKISLDQLCSTGFRLSVKIYNDVLRTVGET